MKHKNIAALSTTEQEHTTGGLSWAVNWGCFASGIAIGVGAATLQPELIGYGIFGAYVNC